MKNKQDIFKTGGWLVMGLIFLFLSGGDLPLGLAAWLAPLFLLRFFRETKVIIAVLILLPALTATNILSNQGMLPLPSFKIQLFLTLNMTVWYLLPYLLDRVFHRHLPLFPRIFLFPALAVSIPFLRSIQGTWFHIANTQNNLPFLQIASLAGVSGISFVIHWTASFINEIWERKDEKTVALKLAVVLAGVLIIIYGFGVIRLRTNPSPAQTMQASGIIPDPHLREKMMGNFADLIRSDPRQPGEVENIRREWKDIYYGLLEDTAALAGLGAEIMVWPEFAALVFEDEEHELIQAAVDAAKKNRIDIGLSIGVYQNKSRSPKPGIQPLFKNKLIFISREGAIQWEHSKGFLAPGMEAAVMIPGDRELKSGLSGGHIISGAICYEMDFPRYIRQSSRLGADLLIAPSNDWFQIKNMHARMARLRAIENGVSVFRPASGGISTAVDPFGRIISSSDLSLGTGMPVTASLPVGRVSTLFPSWGDHFLQFCTLLSFFSLIWGLYQKLLPMLRNRESRRHGTDGGTD
jgi:apolipoprotein N-acyltransferase